MTKSSKSIALCLFLKLEIISRSRCLTTCLSTNTCSISNHSAGCTLNHRNFHSFHRRYGVTFEKAFLAHCPTIDSILLLLLLLTYLQDVIMHSRIMADNQTWDGDRTRSEEHTYELQSLMRNSYAV